MFWNFSEVCSTLNMWQAFAKLARIAKHYCCRGFCCPLWYFSTNTGCRDLRAAGPVRWHRWRCNIGRRCAFVFRVRLLASAPVLPGLSCLAVLVPYGFGPWRVAERLQRPAARLAWQNHFHLTARSVVLTTVLKLTLGETLLFTATGLGLDAYKNSSGSAVG